MAENEKNVSAQLIPFTLPNGDVLTLGPLTLDDNKALDKWVRAHYLEMLPEATAGMPPEEKRAFTFEAWERAMLLDSMFGLGRRILVSNTEGLACMAYRMVKSPAMTFEKFCGILYPNGVTSLDDLALFNSMMAAVYGKAENQEAAVIDSMIADVEEMGDKVG